MSEQHGAGVSAKLGGREIAVGKLAWILDGSPEPPEVSVFRGRVTKVSPTIVYVSIDGAIAGALVFDDQVRADAALTMRALRRTGVDKIVMATGDHPLVTRSVGMTIGVDDILAGLPRRHHRRRFLHSKTCSGPASRSWWETGSTTLPPWQRPTLG